MTTKIRSFRLTPKAAENLAQMAEKHNLSANNVVNRLLEDDQAIHRIHPNLIQIAPGVYISVSESNPEK